MGMGRFLGKNVGVSYSKGEKALGLFFLWLIGGFIITIVLSMLILPNPSFTIPVMVYIFGLIVLFIRYLSIEQKGGKK